MWESWIERDAESGSGRIVDCVNMAIAELAVRLGCSKTVAQSFSEFGCGLQLRLPVTRASFTAGDLDLARVRAICRETAGLSPATVAAHSNRESWRRRSTCRRGRWRPGSND